MNKQALVKAIIQALCEDEMQDNTNYNDIAEAAVRIYGENSVEKVYTKEEVLALTAYAFSGGRRMELGATEEGFNYEEWKEMNGL